MSVRSGPDEHTIDQEFSLPLRHRLRFTRDVLGDDADVLFDLLESSTGPAKVIVAIDRGIASGSEFVGRFEAMLRRRPERVRQMGETLLIESGEACKNSPAEVRRVLQAINDHDIDRRSYVIVIGGGAVLDAVGYAASIAHRGVRLIRLPTTTLAQDDSGIGVKSAINYFGKKNWLGAFAVPWAVINDAALLESLPEKDFCVGFSEAVKVSLLKDASFFDQLCENAGKIAARDPDASQAAIRRSAVLHLHHITRGGDPFEMLEARPLDFGHWSAHRLEAMTHFELRHGEAVGIGVALDCLYSVRTQGLSPQPCDRAIQCLRDLKIELDHPALDRDEELLQGLEEFRQHLGGRLTITLVRAAGEPVDVHEIDHDVMRQCIRELRGT